MNQTKVVNIYHEKYDVYMGRPGKGMEGPFGSPIRIGYRCPECQKVHKEKGDTIPCFTKNFYHRLETSPIYRNSILGLKGLILGCFCRPRNGFQGKVMCHAQIIAGYLDGIPPDQVE
jgi:hypothetical protein